MINGILDIQDVKDYLGIDYEDNAITYRLNHLIKTAERYLEGKLGVGYPKEDERVKELALIVISDLYDNHDMSEKVSGNVRKLVIDFSLQIKLEMRRQNKETKNGF